MSNNCKTDPNCKPSNSEKRPPKKLYALKVVLKATLSIYAFYKQMTKVYDFFKEFLD